MKKMLRSIAWLAATALIAGAAQAQQVTSTPGSPSATTTIPGTQLPAPSLGTMLSEGRNVLMLSPWSAVFSGLAILILAFALNLLGDVMRDTLDPRLRGER